MRHFLSFVNKNISHVCVSISRLNDYLSYHHNINLQSAPFKLSYSFLHYTEYVYFIHSSVFRFVLSWSFGQKEKCQLFSLSWTISQKSPKEMSSWTTTTTNFFCVSHFCLKWNLNLLPNVHQVEIFASSLLLALSLQMFVLRSIFISMKSCFIYMP